MPFLNIIFHNTRHGGTSINHPNSRFYYSENFINGLMNVYQTHMGSGSTIGGGAGVAIGAWGNCVTGGHAGGPVAGASGIFLCESPPYVHADYANYWGGVAPAVPAGVPSALPVIPNFVNSGFAPVGAGANNFCAFFKGIDENVGVGVQAAVAPVNASPHWFNAVGNQALTILGTGAAHMLAGAAPPGSDRYGLLFQARFRTYPGGGQITGIFIHTKNTSADAGTQIASLCRRYPDTIIFGDLNLNMRKPLQYESLADSVHATHRILALGKVGGGNFYKTRYVGGGGGSCLDFALVPTARISNVELWAHHNGGAAWRLARNFSDHSVMVLRIQCT